MAGYMTTSNNTIPLSANFSHFFLHNQQNMGRHTIKNLFLKYNVDNFGMTSILMVSCKIYFVININYVKKIAASTSTWNKNRI